MCGMYILFKPNLSTRTVMMLLRDAFDCNLYVVGFSVSYSVPSNIW